MTIRCFVAICDTKIQFNISFFEMDSKHGACFLSFSIHCSFDLGR